MNELVYSAMLFSAQKFIEETVNVYMGAIVSIREVSLEILKHSYFVRALLYVQGIAALLLTVKVAFEAKAVHIMRLNGDPEADPYGLLKGASVSAAVIATIPWIVQQVWIFGLSVQREVGQLPGTDLGSEQDALLSFLLNCLSQTGQSVLFLGVIVAVVVFLLVIFQSIVYAVDITIIAVMGFWNALGLTNDQSNAFSIWWKDLQGASLVPALQLLILKGAFALWGSFGSLDPAARLLLFIGFMYGAYRVPQKIQMYIGYTSSGVGRTSVSMTQTIINKMLTRR
ncbi:conjugal transfer protein TrbL family protein [Brevibacillus formosus]|uniref:conjugal transfer protein TrbL family protein n=1 Tax=Brevibacillus formosus TaxID=54913 RepID=UPI00358DA89F